jgi:hypothetical protein
MDCTLQDTPLLAAFMDVQAAYSCGIKETANLCLRGLRVETQIVAGHETATTAASTGVMANLHGGILRQGAGITQVRCLLRACHSSRVWGERGYVLWLHS